MSADRLRAAADRLEESDCLDRCSDPGKCCVHAGWQDYPDPWNLPVDPPDLTTAALLRAVADLASPIPLGSSERRWTDARIALVNSRALALADTILGGTDD